MNTQSKTGMKTEEPIPGLRDFMANSALSVLGNVGFFNPEQVAQYCYRLADAMIKEREKRFAK